MGSEPTGVDVEGPQVLVEPDVQELAASAPGSVTGGMHDTDTDTSVPIVGVDHDVFDERVDRAIPEHVDEADEAAAVSCDDPAETVAFNLIDPVPLGLVEQSSIECGGLECVDLVIRERAAPRVRDARCRIRCVGNRRNGSDTLRRKSSPSDDGLPFGSR